MNYSNNPSLTSLNDNNYYDISISNSKNQGQKSNVSIHNLHSSSSLNSVPSSKKKFANAPKRISSLSSLATLNELHDFPKLTKRPGDYYIQKLAKSSLILSNPSPKPKQAPPIARSKSRESIVSFHTSYSDDISLIASSQFDSQSQNITHNPVDSRLSSLTSTTVVNSSSLDSQSYRKEINGIAEDTDDRSFEENSNDDSYFQVNETLRNMANSSSTLDLKQSSPRLFRKNSAPSASSDYIESAINLSYSPPNRPQLRTSSTSNIPTSSIPQRTTSQTPQAKFASLKSFSTPTLNCSKTRYISSKETKERQQLRKKMYEENYNDDEILSNDLDHLVFNVPVIKNHSELYMMNSQSTPGSSNSSKSSLNRKNSILHSDLIADNDNNKYNIHPTNSNLTSNSGKPFPLPGRLGSHVDLSNVQDSRKLNEDRIDEEDDEIANSTNDDSEVTQNITNLYNQRSASISKLIKISREQNMMYKLPNFIKSQSSMEDLHLISPEKLNLIDQTRPINLPPKTTIDKSKHKKEFQKVLSIYEINTKNLNDARKKSNQFHMQNQQLWIKVVLSMIDEPDQKLFNKSFGNQKHTIRKLAWDSNIPATFRFPFFMKILSSNCNSHDSVNTINNSFSLFDQKYENLSETIRSNKDVEFDKTIEAVMKRPLFDAILKEVNNDFCPDEFASNFKYLLYIKSLSEFGLHKHDEIFLIPILLILFQNNQTLQEIYCMLELINQQIFDREFLAHFNKVLSKWNNLKASYSESNHLYKFLSKFKSLSEFDNMTSNTFFEILIQFNDKLPLSLSAPSTPIMGQSNQFNFVPSPNSSNLSFVSNMTENIPEDITPRTSNSNNSEDYINDINSSAAQLVIMLLQLLIVYSNSIKSKSKNHLKVLQSFLMATFKYYHINWNDYSDLIKNNKSIRLNNSADQVMNLSNFVERWKDNFKNI
jgi:hypothetical protein